MNNIRQIINERLENASLDYRYWLSGVGFDGIIEPDFYKIEGQIEAYQDCLNLIPEDLGELSDGYHTFNSLYEQRCILFATIVNQNKNISWKSYKHEDGQLCFGGGWFIVGIDTPKGSYTYHYENKYWDLFECQELECGKKWDGHTDKDIARVLSLTDPRTEDDILKDFEALGYKIKNDSEVLRLKNNFIEIYVYKQEMEYGKEDIFSCEANRFTMQEHKLLNELFEVWGW